MKKHLITVLATALLSVSDGRAGDFDRGFEQGYKAENPGLFLTPLAPIPSIPEIGQTEFQAGIAAGVRRGQEDRGDPNE